VSAKPKPKDSPRFLALVERFQAPDLSVNRSDYVGRAWHPGIGAGDER
jgi:hypothetical protein